MVNVRFDVKSRLFPEKAVEAQSRVLFRSMLKMHELAVRNAPVDTGGLRRSINLEPKFAGASQYVLSDGVSYGVHVEYGSSPHRPPVDALKGWARRVLGDANAAFAVAKKIERFGVEAQPFMRPAFDEVRNFWLPKFVKDQE